MKTTLTLIGLLFVQFVMSQNALRATGGTGLHKEEIFWLNFDGVTNLGPGGAPTLSRSFTINGAVITIVIDNISFSGSVSGGVPLANVRLEGYRPGSWIGDGIDEVYNIGGPNGANTLVNALSTNLNGAGAGLRSDFRVSTYATVNGQPFTLGLVFASGENDAFNEYSQGATNGTPWKLLESHIQAADGPRRINFSPDMLTANMQMGSADGAATGNVALLQTSLQATSSVNPLVVQCTTNGGGKAGIAIGVIVNQDNGDLSTSYGIATNLLSFDVTGGTNNPVPGDVFLSSGTGGGTPVITAGSITNPVTPRLGAIAADVDGNYPASPNGLNDDVTELDDEDAFSTDPSIPNFNTATTYAVNVPAFKNTPLAATPAYIMGWVDFNNNGIFEPAEYADVFFTTNNSTISVPLAWSIGARSAGMSGMRLRISHVNPSTITDDPGTAADERSFSLLPEGETEDYNILLQVPDMITGNVFHDANGATDATINGTPTNIGGTLFVNVVNTSNTVVASVAVQNDGTFSLSDIPNGNYTVQLSTNAGTAGQAAPAIALPAGWVNTAEGTTAAGDGDFNGSINASIANATPTGLTFNFGIEQLPDSDPKSTTIPQPAVNQIITLDGAPGNPPAFSGSDPEDGVLGAGNDVAITSLPTNGHELRINGTTITTGADGVNPPSPSNPYIISGLIPVQVQIQATGLGSTSTSFTYAFIDQAGKMDASPATYTVNWAFALPLDLLAFSGKATGNAVLLHWTTANEVNVSYFEIERNTGTANEFTAIGKVSAGRSNYQFTDNNAGSQYIRYRLKMTDADGQFSYSKVIVVKAGSDQKISAVPNPVRRGQSLIVFLPPNKTFDLKLSNTAGVMVMQSKSNGTQASIETDRLTPGMYLLAVTGSNGEKQTISVIVR